jgi:putative nucleotidyltransferase with HDIG domain
MAACPQDAQWHAEGDVWTHTKMVCGELERLSDWPELERAAQLKLLFTALLHDSGKPATTRLEPETGRTRSPKHSSVGAELSRCVLRDLGCDHVTREQIVALVRFHGRPPFLLDKPNPEHEVIHLSWFVSNRLLYLFALADTRGRQAKEMSRPEEILHLWKNTAEEHHCFHAPYPFTNAQARFLFYRNRLSSLHYTPHLDYRCKVTMMSGLPGAGKDTWLARHRPALPVIALDAIREDLDVNAGDNQGEVIQAAREQCRERLRAGRDFAFNATNLTRQIRQRWIELFADYGAHIEIVYLEPPVATLLTQNRERVKRVPESVMHRLLERLEPPTVTECHSLIFD